VLAASVADRARILQRHNDFMFPSTYLNRPAEREPPATFGTPSLTGAMGECIRDVWLPPEWLKDPSSATRAEAHDVLERKLTQTVPANALTSPARAELAGLVAGIRQRSVELDLDAFQTVTYGYLLGRMRRLNTATTHPEQVMPLAIPEVFRAAFRLAPQDKGRVHQAVIAQLVPEWGEIPFVTYRTGVQPASILRIWHGPGAAELDGLLQRGPGPVSSLLEPDAVRAALGRVGGRKGGNPEDAILRQFAFAAVADEAFEPDLPPVSLAHATTSRARRVVAGSPLATPARRVLRAARRFESARRRRG
jgi:asparagine synthase (glutamine-hydrolysing)